MRKIIAGTFVSLDGVMQAPGTPEEDPSGGFEHGGWIVPYQEEEVGAMGELFAAPFDLLLGRKTYDIFAAHWPHVTKDPADSDYNAGDAHVSLAFDRARKYVATHAPDTLTWQNSQALGADVAASVRALKKADGPALLIQGSSELIQILLAAELIDEFRLIIFPLVLGKGKRLFGSGTKAASFKALKASATPGGVVITTLTPAGAVKTGSFALKQPSEAEVARRKKL